MRECWQLWDKALPKERCEEIINICKSRPMHDATIFSGNDYETIKDFRKTQVAWVNDPSIQNIMQHYFKTANRSAFGFDIDYLPHSQYGEYTEGSFYNWHHDIDWKADSAYDRKLSIVIQLSDENEYEGGNFEFKEMGTPEGFRAQGSVLVFPSYLVHRVSEITKGTRRSLVNWIEGPRWK